MRGAMVLLNFRAIGGECRCAGMAAEAHAVQHTSGHLPVVFSVCSWGQVDSGSDPIDGDFVKACSASKSVFVRFEASCVA